MLLFINAHYYPDVASTGQHLTDLAEYLAGRGTAVRVLTGRGHYVAGAVDAPRDEERCGVRIRRVRTTTFGRGSRWGRIVDYATFYWRALWTVSTTSTQGLTVIFLTTPPLLAVIGWVASRVRGVRYGIWSMDLHPDAEIAAGMVRPASVLGRVLRWLDARAHRNAAFVVDLGPYMKRRIVAKGVIEDRTYTVPVWGHAEPGGDGADALRRDLGLDGRFVVMYSGNAGLVHDFGAILAAMRLLRDDPRIYFLFAGGGPRRAEIEAFVAEWHLTNFSYRPYFARQTLGDALAVGDVHLVALGAPFAGISVPGKLYGIMAAARPALFVGPSACETADTIRAAGCGLTIDPSADGAPDRIARALRAWSTDPAAARAAGARGREAFETTYTAATNCAAFERVLARIA